MTDRVAGVTGCRFTVGLLRQLKQAASFRPAVWGVGGGVGRFTVGLLRQLKQAASGVHFVMVSARPGWG